MADGMKLFHWISEALSRCSQGDIVIMAESVYEARKAIRETVDDLYYGQHDHMRGIELDEYELGYKKEWEDKLIADVEKEPTVLWDGQPVLIPGSE